MTRLVFWGLVALDLLGILLLFDTENGSVAKFN